MSVTLRDYQAELVAGTRAALRRSRRVLAQLPTGGGKTAIASHIVGSCIAAGWPVWFNCHRAELVAQTSATFRKFGIQHGLIAANAPMQLAAPAQVCSIDTLKGRVAMLPAPKLMIWDECHHIGAAGWGAVQSHFSDCLHLGLSATPIRLDGKGLDAHFDEMVIGPSVADLIERGFLSPYRAFAPSSPDMGGVSKRGGDFSRGESEKRATAPKLVGDVITHWRKFADGMRTVGFAVTVKHSLFMAEQFRAAGIPSAHLDGGTPKAERAQIIRDFADGKILVLWNVDLFGEGFDLSAIAQRDVTIDAAILARPTQSLGLHLQQIGRALRPYPGKVAVILDHAGNIARHGLPDDEREWSLEGVKKGRRGGANDNEPPPPITCNDCFMQIRRPLPPCCPHCGKLIVPEAKEIEVAEGDLVEIDEAAKRALRIQRMREQAQAKTLADLIELGKKRGHNNPAGWAMAIWGSRQGRLHK